MFSLAQRVVSQDGLARKTHSPQASPWARSHSPTTIDLIVRASYLEHGDVRGHFMEETLLLRDAFFVTEALKPAVGVAPVSLHLDEQVKA